MPECHMVHIERESQCGRKEYLKMHRRGYLQIHSKGYLQIHSRGYLQIQGIAESRYRNQRLFSTKCPYLTSSQINNYKWLNGLNPSEPNFTELGKAQPHLFSDLIIPAASLLTQDIAFERNALLTMNILKLTTCINCFIYGYFRLSNHILRSYNFRG